MWMGRVMGGDGEFSRKFPGYFLKISGNFREISGIFPSRSGVDPKTEIDIIQREIKIFTNRFKENDPTIMLDPPAKYLQNVNLDQIHGLLPTTFIYIICVILYVD